ncbi:MAG: PH domain-containing protein [Dermatophilaceae bacterium]
MEGQADGARLRPPTQRVSPRARWMWTVEALLLSAVVAAAQVVWWQVAESPDRSLHVLVAWVSVALAACYVVVMPLWRYRVHRWEATPSAVYTQTGWINQERRIAPVSRIQTVDMSRGPIAAVFRLASVRVTTASAAGPLHITGLDAQVARALVDSLTEATIAEAGDAT